MDTNLEYSTVMGMIWYKITCFVWSAAGLYEASQAGTGQQQMHDQMMCIVSRASAAAAAAASHGQLDMLR